LSPKQARFIEEYLVDLNATQAAIRAGYSGSAFSRRFLGSINQISTTLRYLCREILWPGKSPPASLELCKRLGDEVIRRRGEPSIQ
jgi:hypothetical protein